MINNDLYKALIKQRISEQIINDPNIAFIALTKEKFTIIDSYNWSWLNLFKWKLHKHLDGRKRSKEYAITKINNKQILMHRLIAEKLKLDLSFQIDHINTNGLDNRECNIRIATSNQNQWNRGLQVNNTSGEKGISWNKERKSFEVKIAKNYKTIHMGKYKTLEEAIIARNEAYNQHHGEFARLK